MYARFTDTPPSSAIIDVSSVCMLTTGPVATKPFPANFNASLAPEARGVNCAKTDGLEIPCAINSSACLNAPDIWVFTLPINVTRAFILLSSIFSSSSSKMPLSAVIEACFCIESLMYSLFVIIASH